MAGYICVGLFLKSLEVVAPNFNQNLLRCNDTRLLWAKPSDGSLYTRRSFLSLLALTLAGKSPPILALEPTPS